MTTVDRPTDLAAAFAEVTSPWLQGVFAPVFDERDEPDLEVTGTLPEGLHGSFLRNGPNSMFPPLGGYHIFDGDGMIHGVTFDGEGGASYQNRWIRSAGLLAEMEAGHALFGGLSEFHLPSPEIMAAHGPIKNTANTHIIRHAGKLYALMEGSRPTVLGDDLSTIGPHDFDGKLSGPMTAHPRVDPATGELVFFGSSPVAPYLRVHTADAEGVLTWSTEVEIRGPIMMHDFVVTETRVVVFDLPAVFDLGAFVAGGTGIYWDRDQSARIGILDRGAPGDSITWVETDPFWVFHFLNGHDDGTAIEAVGCRAPRLNTSFGQPDPDGFAPPQLWRWRIDPATATVTEECLDDRATDFPRIDDRRSGMAHRYGYTSHAPDPEGPLETFNGVSKHDLRTGAVEHLVYGPDAACSETVFAADPRSDAEDAGWLLAYVHDRATDRSDVVVSDASTMSEVARVHLPRRVPFGFHGSFLPAEP